jgi:beta-glucosidase/6-phospho-beta-glucosidase/beta-galactosidase
MAGMDSPPRLWWGTAAAATQCEGAAPRSDWAGWEAEGRVPASRDGNGFRTRYEDDVALLAAHGVTHHRLTVEWARLEPSPGRWDDDEVAHLRRVLTAAAGAGVDVWACLLHGTAPGWFTDDERGWLDHKAAGLTWPRHVDRVAEALGDLVAGWVPIHEPDLAARLGYLDGTFPPGRRNEDDHRDARAALRTAEAEAARLLRSGPAPVAVAWRPGEAHEGDDLLVVSAPVGGLAAPLDRVAEEAGHAGVLVVTGDPDPPDDDDARRARLAGAVAEVAAAGDGGLAVAGAFHQPAVDGYEWHRGFDARLGLFDRDRNARPALSALPRPPASPVG